MSAAAGPVATLIAAYNAAPTLARAIRSALSQPETSEVIVVDDASTDASLQIARAEAARDSRVRVLAQSRNQGPAAARNRGLDAATAPVVAVLDSDDWFLPGRFARLLSRTDWDMIADNVLFGTPTALEAGARSPQRAVGFEALTAEAFVRGNLPQAGVARGELGFLKPLLSRGFLDRHGLRYDPALRLGEDYDLYVRMLLSGARMTLTRQAGYAAVVRSTSLSARHGAAELETLHRAVNRHLRAPGLTAGEAEAMQAQSRLLRRKRDHRVYLDTRRSAGTAAALRFAVGAWARPVPLGLQILRDKLGLSVRAADALPDGGTRLLLPPAGQASARLRRDG
ncbi:MAG: glycosyltransferase [Pseudomonadota bacterium]